jgi:hypothetical protein
MKPITATITEVESALAAFIAASANDEKLEGLSAKKLAAAVDALTLKDNVTKDMNQAYNHAHKKWAVNFADGSDGCSRENKLEKIQMYMADSSSYKRLSKDPATEHKVSAWMSKTFES